MTTPNDALKESGFGALKACESVLGAIQKMGHSVRLNVCKTKACLDKIVKRKPGLVILAVKYIHGDNGDDIWLSDYFSQHKINFTGSSRDVLKFDSNKVLAKTHLTNKGIKTAKYFLAIPGQYKTENELPITFPLFLKPLDAANGNGIDDLSFVTNFTDYESKIVSLYDSFNQPALVEEYLDGREFTVAAIKTPSEKLILSAVEVVPPTSTNGLKILGAQAKKDDSETLLQIDDQDLKNRIIMLATDAFNALGVRDFGRIDVKTNMQGECFFIEANLVPGMTYGSSYFPQACDLAHEYSYNEVIELLVAGGLDRASPTNPPHINPDSDGTIAAVL
ncbi:D-alanine--D-alanine ligase [Pseudomonadota bacterium]